MAERLRGSTSPYLLAHADNPVDWWPWGADAFASARERDVPVFVSIGYATCHWCHVMARESFSDPDLAGILNRDFVAIKVDREEHPEVDGMFMTAAGAFTRELGWPLSVFTTPDGGTFFASTYSPPEPVRGIPSFRQILGAVTEAWQERRDDVEQSAAAITDALARAQTPDAGIPLPDDLEVLLAGAVEGCVRVEDTEHGGFGSGPKFPVTAVLQFLLGRPGAGRALAYRTLRAMAASPLRDPVEGGFFRYAVRADWSEPHYERMLSDNALLLDAYTTAALQTGDSGFAAVARGLGDFLIEVLGVEGGFASAQDSESVIDGRRSEGGYYARDAAGRAALDPPALDRKLVTGWNGLAIGALARSGLALHQPRYLASAMVAADAVLVAADEAGRLPRVRLDGRVSPAAAALDDHGMLAAGLLDLATSSGEVRYAVAARGLVDAVLVAGETAGEGGGDAPGGASVGEPFGLPGGGDPVLAAQGRSWAQDVSEGATPAGPTTLAGACLTLHALTGDERYRSAAEAALGPVAASAASQPVAAGGVLTQVRRLAAPLEQLVVVTGGPAAEAPLGDVGDGLVDAALRRAAGRGSTVVACAAESQVPGWTAEGFELFDGRSALGAAAAAYQCAGFVCRLPVTDAAALDALD
ncbi:thioredoxin domain-containing protein [Agromyces seonyuensis]|uniref:DUF255 domain-containing protein n=1 Tax=Agromyces seonyuensis TaxID=2662446 RepID=A0A6I4P5T0_9MICO|nr:DUF255 domain-containing protein [Agromyces seonyuensis]MWB99819.1 DUF255 domain-containing protein [Agromyces seonyuensis]